MSNDTSEQIISRRALLSGGVAGVSVIGSFSLMGINPRAVIEMLPLPRYGDGGLMRQETATPDPVFDISVVDGGDYLTGVSFDYFWDLTNQVRITLELGGTGTWPTDVLVLHDGERVGYGSVASGETSVAAGIENRPGELGEHELVFIRESGGAFQKTTSTVLDRATVEVTRVEP